MIGINLAVILIGISLALKTDDFLILILSLGLGSGLGEFLSVQERLESFGKRVEKRLFSAGDVLSRGFIAASLVFCVGSMAVIGSLESGLTGDHQILFAKSALDGIASVFFVCSFGIGVLFSSISVLVYQGVITLGASLVKPFLTDAVIQQMSAAGGLLIVALGLNMLEIRKIKVANMLPSIFLPPFFSVIVRAWTTLTGS
jgi:uncharacterized membrane protein YqgA involved in biofilm formation